MKIFKIKRCSRYALSMIINEWNEWRWKSRTNPGGINSGGEIVVIVCMLIITAMVIGIMVI